MPADSPNILLLMSDEHSFRHLSRWDDQRGEPVTTPALDCLAESGTFFESAYCQVPICTPSRMCLLTGREAQACGAWTNQAVLRPGIQTLPQQFADAGYETCLVGKMHFGGNRQFHGFNHRPYGDLTGLHGHQREPIHPEERHHDWKKHLLVDVGVTDLPESQHQEQHVLRESLSFLREHTSRHPEQPWFLCASFTRPHPPLTAPQRFIDRYWPDNVPEPKVGPEGDTSDHPFTSWLARRWRLREDPEIDVSTVTKDEWMQARAAYFACVEYLDEIIGDFLSVLANDSLLEETIIVYLSDHGELAGEHGLFWKQHWFEASTRVPFIIQTPDHRDGNRAGSVIRTPVSLADVFPTLASLAGVSMPEGLDGSDLSAAVNHGTEPNRDPVVCDLFAGFENSRFDYRMVRDGRYKYIQFRDAPEVLIDLESDPFELTNLAAHDDPPTALSRLRGFVDESIDFDRIADQRTEDEALQEEYALQIPRGASNWNAQRASHCNAYLLPDGRLVNAETPIYKPDVLADNPDRAFDDWPESSE